VARANAPPVAEAGRDIAARVGEPVILDGGASRDPDGAILAYRWRIEGGMREGPRLAHAFHEPGVHAVALEVEDDRGARSRDSLWITVSPAPNRAPVAVAGPDRIVAPGEVIRFDGTRSRDPDGAITGWRWSFGDGSAASTPVATHAYSAPGRYRALIEVEDASGIGDASFDFCFGDFAELEGEGHVFVDAHVRVERVVLEDHGDVAVLGVDVVDDAFADADLARGDLLEARDHAERGGLAAAGGPDEDDELPVVDVEVEAFDGVESAGVALVDVGEDDLGHENSVGSRGGLGVAGRPVFGTPYRGAVSLRRPAASGQSVQTDHLPPRLSPRACRRLSRVADGPIARTAVDRPPEGRRTATPSGPFGRRLVMSPTRRARPTGGLPRTDGGRTSMSTSQRTMSQVRSILSKLDRTRSASRNDGQQPEMNPVEPAGPTPGDDTPIDADTLIGGPKKAAPSAPAARPAPPAQDPNRPGAQFGRAKPIPFRG